MTPLSAGPSPWLPVIATIAAAALTLAGAIVAAIVNHRLQERRELDKVNRERAENICMRISIFIHYYIAIATEPTKIDNKDDAHSFLISITVGERATEMDKVEEEMRATINIYYERHEEFFHNLVSIKDMYLKALAIHVNDMWKEFVTKGIKSYNTVESPHIFMLKDLRASADTLKRAIIEQMRQETRQHRPSRWPRFYIIPFGQWPR